jgi:hypothetical protein
VQELVDFYLITFLQNVTFCENHVKEIICSRYILLYDEEEHKKNPIKFVLCVLSKLFLLLRVIWRDLKDILLLYVLESFF